MASPALQFGLAVWLVLAGRTGLVGATGDPAPASPQSYQLKRWTTEDGLPQNRISCLEQTSDGYLWIGTWNGLARFDGLHFTVFTKFDTPALGSNDINALAEDNEGTLWIATADGLVSYRDHQFQRMKMPKGLPGTKVWRLAPSRFGGVWVETEGYVTRLKDGRFSPPLRLPSAPTWFEEGPDEQLHMVMDRMWLSLAPAEDKLRTNYVGEQSRSWLVAVPNYESNSVWVGTWNGMHFEKGGMRQEKGPEQLGTQSVGFLGRDRAGNLWVKPKRAAGFYRSNGLQWTAVDLEEHVAPSPVVCMKEDREGNLWFGTENGLVRLKQRQVRSFTTNDGLTSDHAWSVCEGSDGTIWVAGQEKLSRIQNDRVVPIEEEEPEYTQANRAVWPAADGGVWLAKINRGVLEVRQKFVIHLEQEQLLDLDLKALYMDRSGRLWIGGRIGAVAYKDGALGAVYTNKVIQPLRDVLCLLEDRQGTFWFGTQGHGLMALRNGAFKTTTTSNGLSSDHVWALYEDTEGSLWIGTDNGLTLRQHERFHTLTTTNGLLENKVHSILEDEFGYLWLSGMRGIYRIKREQLKATAQGSADSLNVAVFGTADGMASSETNGENQPAGWRARDGRLWFPTTRGVVVIDPKTLATNQVAPTVVIEEVRADDQIIYGDRKPGDGPQGGAKPQLAPGTARVLQVRYAANCLTAPERVRFKYQLKPSEGAWHDVGGQRTAVFTNLRPGHHIFQVKACNQNGVWSETLTEFAFFLAPHFWQTRMFKILCVGALVLAGLGMHLRRVSVLRRIDRLERQQAVQTERARIARDLHDDMGASLTGIALKADLASRQMDASHPGTTQLAEIAASTRGLVDGMRETVWALNPKHDILESLARFLAQQVEDYALDIGLRCRLELPNRFDPVPVSSPARYHLHMIVKEALHNIARHAGAREIQFNLAMEQDSFCLIIADDGNGFDATKSLSGAVKAEPGTNGNNGLPNMRQRIDHLGGQLELHSLPGQGTSLTVRIPVKAFQTLSP